MLSPLWALLKGAKASAPDLDCVLPISLVLEMLHSCGVPGALPTR